MPLKKPLFIFLVCWMAILPSFAQTSKLDSLLAVTKTGNINDKINALNNIGDLLMFDKPEEAKYYLQQSIKKADSIQYKPGLGDACNKMGIVYDVTGNFDSSLFYYEKAKKLYTQINNLKGLGSVTNNFGLIYWNTGDYEKALAAFFDAVKYFEKIKNEKFEANALNNIGMVYFNMHDFKNSIKYHLQAKSIYDRLNDNYFLGAVCTNLGNVYSTLKMLDSAEHYYVEAIRLHSFPKDDYGLSIAYNGYAGLLAAKGDTAKALTYFEQTLRLKESLNEQVGEASILHQVSLILHAQRRFNKELDYLSRAKEIAEKNNLKKELIDIYKSLATFYEGRDNKLAYDYYKKYSVVKDSIYNEKGSQQLAELNTKYETGKTALKLKQKDLQLAKQQLYISAISGIFIVLLLLGFALYKRYQLRQERKFQAAALLQQDEASKAVIVAEENERKRIAADLHDGVGQMMSAAKMNLSVFENEFAFSSADQKNSFEKLISLVDDSCREIRSVSHQMMPNALLKTGLASAVQEFINKIDSKIIRISLHTEGLEQRIDHNIETVLYRVIQECVNNVLKHASAKNLDISMIKDADGISISIEDNGRGFDSSDKLNYEGIGLKNIITRINFLKGTVEFDSAAGKGTLVAIHVPVMG